MSLYMEWRAEQVELQARLGRENIVLLKRSSLGGYDICSFGNGDSNRIEFRFDKIEDGSGYVIKRGEMTNMWDTRTIATARNKRELNSKLYTLAKRAALEKAKSSKSKVVEE